MSLTRTPSAESRTHIYLLPLPALQIPDLACFAMSLLPAGFYKFVVHNVKELELLLMHNR